MLFATPELIWYIQVYTNAAMEFLILFLPSTPKVIENPVI